MQETEEINNVAGQEYVFSGEQGTLPNFWELATRARARGLSQPKVTPRFSLSTQRTSHVGRHLIATFVAVGTPPLCWAAFNCVPKNLGA